MLGASKGIGRGIAEALAREGARVAIASRSLERLEQAAAEIEGDVIAFEAETGDLDRLARLPGEVAASSGRWRSSSPTRAGRRWAWRWTPNSTSGEAPTSR